MARGTGKSGSAALKLGSQLAGFVARAPMALCLTDIDLTLIEVSPKWLQVPADRSRRTEVIRAHAGHDVQLSRSDNLWQGNWQRCLAGEIINAERVPVKLPDGARGWFQIEVHPWRDSDGVVSGAMISAQDVTDLTHALEESKRSEQRLNLAARLADVHVWEMDFRRKQLFKFGAEDDFYETPNTYEELLNEDIYRNIHPARSRARDGGLEGATRNTPDSVQRRVSPRAVGREGDLRPVRATEVLIDDQAAARAGWSARCRTSPPASCSLEAAMARGRSPKAETAEPGQELNSWPIWSP